MTEDRETAPDILGKKRGFPIYETNPSLPNPQGITRIRQRKFGDSHKGMVFDTGSGEVLGPGSIQFYELEEVDGERFVKLYLGGVKMTGDLTKAGLTVFEVVFHEMRENPNTDRVNLSLYAARRRKQGLTDRNYQRGLRELLDKGMLFRSPYEGTFFINVLFAFNGDRLNFIKQYQLKGTQTQPELPGFSEVAALPAPADAD